ncbi:MAG: hypothetical protein JNK02_07940 [Planctomycetes bacterium]|nr:hypothetical protein [Planctomycetota bacterium]
MSRLAPCLVLVISAACAAPPERPPRAAVFLPYRAERVTAVATPEPELESTVAVEAEVEPSSPSASEPEPTGRSRRFEVESPALTRAFGRPRTVGAEVVLPEAGVSDTTPSVVYHVPDLGEDPVHVAERLARIGVPAGLVLVVLDPRGIRPHHLFLDSVNEGPNGEALVTDLIPVLERHLFAGAWAERRFLTGSGLGGASVIRLQLDYAHAFDAVYAFDPDPLDMRSFYGLNLPRVADEGPSAGAIAALRLPRVAARLACLESALGARGDDGIPQPLIARHGSAIQADVVAAFGRRDSARFVRERGRSVAARLDRKIHAVARRGDPLGRDESLRSFADELSAAGLTFGIRIPDDYDFTAAITGAWSAMLAAPRP